MHIRAGDAAYERHLAVDIATGLAILDVVEADDEGGWYRVLKRMPDGELAVTEDGRQIHTRVYAAIRIEERAEGVPKRRRPKA